MANRRSNRNDSADRRSTDPADYQDVSAPVAAMQKTFPDKSTTGRHYHRRHQLIYAAQGTMRIDTDGENWVVPPARAVFMPGHCQHDVSAVGTVDMCTLYIEPAALAMARATPFVILVTPLLRELIRAILAEPVAYSPDSRGAKLAGLILDEITRSKPLNLSIAMPSEERLLRVCRHIIADPSAARSIDDLAEAAGASTRTLTRLFRRELGQSLSEWRQQVRFHFALGAVARGEPIGKIAADCGYRSPSAFAAAFRKSFGVPPSQIVGSVIADVADN